MDDDAIDDVVRSADEVARRALTLFGVWGLTSNAVREDVLNWLAESNLFEALSPMEAGLVDVVALSKKQRINLSWQSERLIVLLWALGHVEQLPSADMQCDTSVFGKIMPPFADIGVRDFIDGASLRSEAELLEFADTCLDLHWQARDAALNRRPPKVPVDIEVIQERHHAINWIIGYCGLPWDEVTTDT